RDAHCPSQLRLNPDADHAHASAEESASSAGTQRGRPGVSIATDRREASRAMPTYVPSRPTNGLLAQMTRRLGVVERLRQRELLVDAELFCMYTSVRTNPLAERQHRLGFK
ncbi:hypothetical protein ACMZ49_22475, partial [Alcaligenes phenolicus]